MSSPQIDNLTEALQRHLGLQQAQSLAVENITADAISRLTGRRGDVTRLVSLWSDDGHKLVEGWNEKEHRPVLRVLREVLDSTLVLQHERSGLPKSFLALSPELVTQRNAHNVFRDFGRSVVEGLWSDPELRKQLKQRVDGFRSGHPLAHVMTTLTRGVSYEDKTKEAGHLASIAQEDPQLRHWLDTVVVQDWRAWLVASQQLSIDEQLESMTALIGLHLHVALLWRLRNLATPDVAPCYFAAIAGHGMHQACVRAAYNCYAFWGDRSADALTEVAQSAIERAAEAEQELKVAFTADSWLRASPWTLLTIRGKQASRATRAFQEALKAEIQMRSDTQQSPQPGEAKRVLVDALVQAFSTESGVATKAKDYLRVTGRCVGLVGPDAKGTRKRYQMDERALALLARLHAARPAGQIASNEEDPNSLEAFLDDIFHRYGIIVTRERDRIRERIESGLASPTMRSLLRFLPDEEAMRRNRAQFDRRLDELRVVRRYSDASAVIHIA